MLVLRYIYMIVCNTTSSIMVVFIMTIYAGAALYLYDCIKYLYPPVGVVL